MNTNALTNSDEIEWWSQHLFRPSPDLEPQPEPQPVDIESLSFEEFAAMRGQLGVKDSNGVLGSEIHPWQQTKPVNAAGAARAQGRQ